MHVTAEQVWLMGENPSDDSLRRMFERLSLFRYEWLEEQNDSRLAFSSAQRFSLFGFPAVCASCRAVGFEGIPGLHRWVFWDQR